MRLFYTPDIVNDIFLPEEESKHAIKVLRLSIGDHINCIDGTGNLYKSSIKAISGKKVELNIHEKISNYNKPKAQLHIAIAPTKNIDRFEWFLEKATEIGISEITPLICFHSERRILKLERLEKVLIAAMKQTLTAYKPKLNEPVEINDFFNTISGNIYIAHCDNPENKLTDVIKHNEPVTILIGPEGDFSKEEIDAAKHNGYIPVSLGSRRLRTETAGLIACHTVQLIQSNYSTT